MTMVSPGALTPVERSRPPSQGDREDDAMDLGAYVAQIWAYRIGIIAVAIVCAAAAAIAGLVPSLKYEAQVSVIVSQSKVGDRPEAPAAVAMSTFLPLLQSTNVAAGVIREKGLDKPPRNLRAVAFFADVATIEQVRDSPVVALKVVLDDPALAADVANSIAEKAVVLSRGVSQREAMRASADLEERREDAKTRMDQTSENLRKFQASSQAELLRKDVTSMLDQRGELLPLLIEIEAEKAKLAKAEDELSGRKPINTLVRSIIDSDQALVESARRVADPAGNLLSLETKNEVVNAVYDDLDQLRAESRSTLAALERKKTQIVDVRKLDASQVPLLTKLYEVDSELLRLGVERDLATAVYKQVATAYETARVQVASRSAQPRSARPRRPA